jgi:hypothetical protein
MGQNTITTAIAATLLASSAASAAISANAATISLSANGAAQTVSNNATDLGDGRFAHTGMWASNGMLVQWSNLITAYTVVNGVETAYVSGGFTIKNNNATTPLVLDLSVLMAGSMGAGATYAGSAGGQGVNFSFNPGSLGATAVVQRLGRLGVGRRRHAPAPVDLGGHGIKLQRSLLGFGACTWCGGAGRPGRAPGRPSPPLTDSFFLSPRRER